MLPRSLELLCGRSFTLVVPPEHATYECSRLVLVVAAGRWQRFDHAELALALLL